MWYPLFQIIDSKLDKRHKENKMYAWQDQIK